MASIATSPSGKVYAVGEDGFLYVRTGVNNQWHRTLETHSGFTAVEVDCRDTIWVLKNKKLFTVENGKLKPKDASRNLVDFSTFGAGFVAITKSGKLVMSDSTNPIEWKEFEDSGDLISIDSYLQNGLLGVYPDGLKVRESLNEPWTDVDQSCGMKDATELISASFCNGTEPLVKLLILLEPAITEGIPDYPYEPTVYDSFRASSNVVLVCQVTFTGTVPNVYMKYGGLIIPNKQITTGGSLIAAVYQIPEINFDNQGLFSCYAETDQFMARDIRNITVFDELVFTESPSDQTSYPGGNLVLTAQASTGLTPLYSWYKFNTATNSSSLVISNSHISFYNGELRMFDVQPAQEGQYYCVASNGWYNVTSQVVSVTIMFPHYIMNKEGKQYVGENVNGSVPVYTTAGTLDAAAYNGTLYIVGADYKVYSLTEDTLTLLPNSCCVNSIAVYNDLGDVVLIATDIQTFKLVYRSLDGDSWTEGDGRINTVHVAVVADEIVAVERLTGDTIIKQGLEGSWTVTGVKVDMLHIAGPISTPQESNLVASLASNLVLAVGYDRRLYVSLDVTTAFVLLDIIDGVEVATIDADSNTLYIILTSGTILTRNMDDVTITDNSLDTLTYDASVEIKEVPMPQLEILHVSWQGVHYYTDGSYRVYESVAYTALPALSTKIKSAWSMVTLADRSLLILNKNGLKNVTQYGNMQIRKIPGAISMSLYQNKLLVVVENKGLHYILLDELKSGELVQVDKRPVMKLFSVQSILAKLDTGAIVSKDNVLAPWLEESVKLDAVASTTLLRINSRTPNITTVAKTYYVEIGDEILMMCKATGIPTPQVTVTPYLELEFSQSVRPDYRGLFQYDDTSVMETSLVTSIIVINAENNMPQWYRCEANNMYGTSLQYYKIVIWKQIEFTETPESSVVDEGKDFILNCAAVALPDPVITWFKDGKPVGGDHLQLSSGGLLLTRVNTSDAGDYTCRADNEQDSKEVSATIIVKRPIVYTAMPQNTTQRTTSTVSLDCSAIGIPTPVITWYYTSGDQVVSKDRLTVHDNGTLTITDAKLSDSITLFCNASNQYESHALPATITIKEPEVPSITVPPKDTIVFEGQTMTLTCKASGDPKPNVYIVKDGQGVPANQVFSNDNGEASAILVLSSVGPSTQGSYHCIAVNQRGEDKATALITVFERVEVTTAESLLIVQPSLSLVLTCTVTGSPDPSVTWAFYNKDLETSRKYSFAQSSSEYTLTITPFTSLDVGDYSCRGENKLSSDTDTTSVNIQVPYGWTNWTSCDVVCGEGTEVRQALCNNLIDGTTSLCKDGRKERRTCSMPECPKKPYIDSYGPVDNNVVNGSTVMFTCEVSGSPPLSITWTRDGRPLSITQDITIFSFSNKYMLKWANLQIADGGVVACKASNTLGEDQEEMELTVELLWSEWTVWSECTEACDGGTRTRSRTCLNADNKKCLGGTTEIENCNTFSCERSAPVIITEVEDRKAVVGSCVTFTCSAGGIPVPVITWWSGEGQLKDLDMDSDKYQIATSEGTSTLSICNLTFEDAECYNCLAVNSEGVTMTTGMLAIVSPPEIIHKPANKDVVEGAFVELLCDAQGMPQPEINWKYKGAVFSHQFVLQSDSSLRFTNISAEQAGVYTCEAVNSAGVNFVQAEISVTAINGNWGEWGGWSSCDKECGEGERVRQRLCDSPTPSMSGDDCVGSASDTEECKDQACQAENRWLEWTAWSECSPSCGLGKHSRVRSCDGEEEECAGDSSQIRMCFNEWCPVDGGYSAWSVWSECSRECDSGNQTRTRTCTDPRPQHGGRPCLVQTAFDVRQCNTEACPVKPKIVIAPEDVTTERGVSVTFICAAEGNPTPSVAWFEDDLNLNALVTTSGQRTTSYLIIEDTQDDKTFNCLAQNEAGAKLSSVDLIVNKELPEFVQFPVDTVVAEDTDMALHCEVDDADTEVQWLFNNKPIEAHFTDALSLQNGTLLLQDVSMFHTGRYTCAATNDIGTSDKTAFITVQAIQGGYSPWKPWSNCTVLCGEGVKTRDRVCDSPAPSSNGMPCTGAASQTKDCKQTNCDEVAEYGAWSDCSRMCDGGIRTRLITCTTPDCPRVDMEVCNSAPCPISGNYTEWSDWSRCSVSCGEGTMSRTRTCTNPRTAYGGEPCPGPQKEVIMDTCSKGPCPRPTILISGPTDLTMSVGSTAVFSATYMGSPQPTVAWLANGEPVFNTSKIQLVTKAVGDMYMSTMSLLDLKISDEKVYSIILTSANRKPILDTVSLKVTLTPVITDRSLTFVKKEGEDLMIDCQVTSRPMSFISWSPLSPRGSVLANNSLFLDNLMLTDSGMYTCTALNTVGVAVKEARITVTATDGGLSAWTAWSECNSTCGGGTRTRSRQCNTPAPSASGSDCTGELEMSMQCTNDPCPIDGQYTQWTDWTPCSVSCGLGSRRRAKSCTDPAPQYNGRNCSGAAIVEQGDTCFERNCPIDGGWSDWTSWSQCSVTCGGGLQTRTRGCSNPIPMFNGSRCGPEEPDIQQRDCNQAVTCPEHPIVFPIADQEGSVGDSMVVVCRIHANPSPDVRWMRDSSQVLPDGRVSITDKKMDKTTTVSKMTISNAKEVDRGIYVCLATNVAGSNLETFTLTIEDDSRGVIGVTDVVISEGDTVTLECVAPSQAKWKLNDVSLSPGTKFRFQGNNLVVHSATVFISGQYTCEAEDRVVKHFDLNVQVVHGGVSQWSAWSTCSGAGCGAGQRIKTRACNNPLPSANGKQCKTALLISEDCSVPCLSSWSDWSPWSTCSEKCNTGYQSKQRVCVSQGGNSTCAGQGTEVRDCNSQQCVVDGGWGSWNAWQDCSVTCGKGERVRSKECNNPAPAAGGAYCVGDGEEKEECDAGLCPTHGSWSSWKNWTPCSVTCGRGVRYRVKECNNPAPSNGGDACSGLGLEYGECTEKACVEKGSFSDWSDWTPCSATCGSGTQNRSRNCEGKRRLKRLVFGDEVLDRDERSVKCEGVKEESRACQSTECAEIIFSPQSTDANVGDTASFVCQVSRGNMIWKKGDVTIEDEGRIRVTYRGQSSVLKISNIIASDADVYSCVVTKGTFSETASANLSVFEPPIITFSTEQQFVRLGEKASIECVATGRPAPNIDIIQEGAKRKDNQKLVASNPTAYLVRNTLTIQYMKAEDEGVYVCLASNSRGIDERMTVLSITVDGGWSDWTQYTDCTASCGEGTKSRTRTCTNPAPANGGRQCAGDDLGVADCDLLACHTVPVFRNTISTLRVTAGDRVMLPVTVTANPDPTVMWLTPNGPADMMIGIEVLSNSSLVIEKVRLKDSGVYKVLATNDAGIAEFFMMLIVDGREPEYIEPLSNITVTSGHSLQLEVTAAGSPLPLLTFIRVMPTGERIVLVSQTLSREAGEISARYSIDFVLPTDAGQYIVQAENEYGMTETTGWVNVVTDLTAAQVSILVSSPIRALSGDRVVVPVEITGVPTPRFTWTTPTSVQPKQIKIHANGTLVVPAIDIGTSGEYTINVFNADSTSIVPSDSESITIVVVGTKANILNATSSLVGDTLSFSCFVKGIPLPSIALTGPSGISVPVSVDVIGTYNGVLSGEATIMSPDADIHTGTYTLTATNKFATATKQLEVVIPANTLKAPVFNSSFESIKLFHGQSDMFKPVVEGRPAPVLTLEPASGRVYLNRKGVIKFKEVKKADSGVYTLKAVNSEGTAKSIVVLEVVGKIPSFIGQFPNLTLPHRVPHTIVVTAVGLPAPTLEAEKVQVLGDPVPVVLNSRTVQKDNITTISITLDNPEVSDSGWYIIKASNVYGTNSTNAYLNFTTVTVKPRIISGLQSAEIKEHTPLTLSVTVDGVPEPSVTMAKDGVKIPLFRQAGEAMRYTYTAPVMGSDNTGLYTVTAENELGTATTQATITMDRAELPPYFIVTPSGPVTLQEGDTLRLVTKVGGAPDPVVTWVKSDGAVPRGNVVNSTLTIPSVEESDSGQYIVKAINSRGSIYHIVTVTVQSSEAPTTTDQIVTSTPAGEIDNVESLRVRITLPLPDEVYHSVGDDLTLYVEGVASPMQLTFKVLQKTDRWDDITEKVVTQVKQLDMTNFNASVTLPNDLVRASSDLSVEISNVVGADTTSTRITVVAGASERVSPYFDPAPDSQSVYPEESVYLTTRALGSLPLTVSWYLDNQKINTNDDNYKIYTNGTLRINKIKPGQTGTYSVKALNTEGSSKANVLINIVYAAEWSSWSQYGACSAQCKGKQVRARSCSNPPPKDGYSNNCSGDRTQIKDCGASVCPAYSDWSVWTDCSADCGYGMRSRNRLCDAPAPAAGEPGCDGLAKETRACYLKSCPDRVDGEWTEWTSWSDCSVSCGTGEKRRDRSCSNPLPSGGGATCEGTGHETVVCVERSVCPRGAGWGDWGVWSECSLSCGGGTQSRDRNCAEGGCVGNTAQVRDCNTGDCAMRNVKKNVVGEPESQIVLYKVKIGKATVCLPLNTSINTKYYTLLEEENTQLYATVNEEGHFSSFLLYSGEDSAKISTNVADIPSSVGDVTITTKKKYTVLSSEWFALRLHKEDIAYSVKIVKMKKRVTGLLADVKTLQDQGVIKKKKEKTLLKFRNTAYVLQHRGKCLLLSSTKLAASLVSLID